MYKKYGHKQHKDIFEIKGITVDVLKERYQNNLKWNKEHPESIKKSREKYILKNQEKLKIYRHKYYLEHKKQ